MSIYTNTINFNTFVTHDIINVCIQRLDTSMIKKFIGLKISKANLSICKFSVSYDMQNYDFWNTKRGVVVTPLNPQASVET